MQHGNAGKIKTKMHMKINMKMNNVKCILIEPNVTLTIEPVNFIAAIWTSCATIYNTLTTLTCIEFEHAKSELIDYESVWCG